MRCAAADRVDEQRTAHKITTEASFCSALARTRPELWREKGYRNGSILRIKMVNFLTYDECEVFPGPKLNVVIGNALAHKWRSSALNSMCDD